ncbi:MAG: helix-turn-helix transcriptional regulator, partial [Hyphomicrobiaceae bacterium]
REIAALDRRRDLVGRMREHFFSSLAHRPVTLDSTAEAVQVTPRQLQSSLRRRHTTFEDELSRARHALAERYLKESDISLTEIALLLGFSELSAFTRAARTWFGMPPSQWRQKARRREGPAQ